MPEGKCPIEPNFNQRVSPVYTQISETWMTTEYDVEMQNFIGDQLNEGAREDTYRKLYVDVYKLEALKPWSRPFYPWKLDCEKETNTRNRAFEMVFNQTFTTV